MKKPTNNLAMAGEWGKFKLRDVALFNPETYSPAERWGYVNYLDTSNITNGSIDSIQLFTNIDLLPSRARRKVQSGDIVYSTVRPNQRHYGIIIDPLPNMLVSTGFAVIRGREGKCYTKFLYYFLTQSHVVEYMHSIAENSTSAYPSIRPSDIESLEIDLPPLPEQRSIAHILGTLDDKIELNRRMSETLEAMARAIFKAWFVDFLPVRAKMAGRWKRGQSLPGLPAHLYDLFPDRLVDSELGKIPEGWEVGVLRDHVQCVKGKSYNTEDLQEGGDTALVTLKSFARGGGYRPDGLKGYRGDFKPEQVVYPGELVIACTDVTQAAEVIGKPAIVRSTDWFKTLVASLDVLVVRPKSDAVSVPFLYCLFRSDEFSHHTYAHSTGTTVLHLDKDAIPSFLFPLPAAKAVTAFTCLAEQLFQRINEAESESRTLAALRDALLPKLISGKIRVKDAEQFLKERGL